MKLEDNRLNKMAAMLSVQQQGGPTSGFASPKIKSSTSTDELEAFINAKGFDIHK